jgi:hypothetical protein
LEAEMSKCIDQQIKVCNLIGDYESVEELSRQAQELRTKQLQARISKTQTPPKTFPINMQQSFEKTYGLNILEEVKRAQELNKMQEEKRYQQIREAEEWQSGSGFLTPPQNYPD